MPARQRSLFGPHTRYIAPELPGMRPTKGNPSKGTTRAKKPGKALPRALPKAPVVKVFPTLASARACPCPCETKARYAAKLGKGYVAVCQRGPAAKPTGMVVHGPDGVVLAVGVSAAKRLLSRP